MKHSQGFTLIELMIVVAIISILASLAITAYSRSITKAQLSEAFNVADGLKIDVADYYHQTGQCPTIGIGDAAGGLASSEASYSGQYVANADVTSAGTSCIITTHMRNGSVAVPLRGKEVTFTMDLTTNGATRWACNSDVDFVYLPQVCR
jgi:type IV pilus assembly protein PilA